MNPGQELQGARPRSVRPTGTGDRPKPTSSMYDHLRPNLEERSHVYQVLEELGRGSFGVIYKAQNVTSEENVAIKAVKVSQGSSSSCLCREGQILKTLNHPNIVNLVSLMNRGSGECPDLVLELCHCSLIDVVRQHRDKIGLGHVKCFALELMEGLRYIHSCHVIHRDIKPHNILLTGDGVLKICDFGVATFVRESYSPYVGCKNFMAPEILLETTRYNWAVDIWAAGCTIAELISGQRFVPGKSQMKLLANMVYLLGTIDRTTLPQRLDLPYLDRYPLPKFDAQIDRQLAQITSNDLARDFMRSLLQLNPDSRLSASDALSHNFFRFDPRPERLIIVADSSDQQGAQVSSESDISAGKEEFPQNISPPAMQNNNEADTVQPQSQSVSHPSGCPTTARDGNSSTTQPQPQAASHAPELLAAAGANAIQHQFHLLPRQRYPQPQIPNQRMRLTTPGNNIAFAVQIRHHQLMTRGNSISFAPHLLHHQLTHPE